MRRCGRSKCVLYSRSVKQKRVKLASYSCPRVMKTCFFTRNNQEHMHDCFTPYKVPYLTVHLPAVSANEPHEHASFTASNWARLETKVTPYMCQLAGRKKHAHHILELFASSSHALVRPRCRTAKYRLTNMCPTDLHSE